MEIIVNIKAYPGSNSNKIDGVLLDSSGVKYLKVRTTQVAESGKANKEIIAIISKVYKIPKSNITLLSGDKSRLKKLRIIIDQVGQVREDLYDE